MNTYPHTGTHTMWNFLISCENTKEGVHNGRKESIEIQLSDIQAKEQQKELENEDNINIIINLHHHYERHYNDKIGLFGYDDLVNKYQADEAHTFLTYRHPLSVIGTHIRVTLIELPTEYNEKEIIQTMEEKIKEFIVKYHHYTSQVDDSKTNIHRIETDLLSAKGQRHRINFLQQLLDNIKLIPTEKTQKYITQWAKKNSNLSLFESNEKNIETYNTISEKVFEHKQKPYTQLYDFCHQDMFQEYNDFFGYNQMTMKGIMDTYHSWF